MTLKGSSNPLPYWIVKAIVAGLYTIHYDEKDKIEYLKGKATNPHGCVIEFQ